MSWKNKHLAILSILTFVFCVFSLLTSTAQASTGVSPDISFEGKIVNSSGVNITNGTYNVEFTMYTGCTNEPTNNTGCTLAWTEDYLTSSSQGVAINGGTFEVNLGQYCAFSGSTCQGNTNTGINWNTYPIYMSMQIGGTANCTSSPAGGLFTANCAGDGVMQPYILMTSTPYAQNAGTLGNIAASGFGQLAIGSQTWTGSNTFEDSTNSATAFQVDNNGAKTILGVDTSGNQVVFGNATTNVGQVVFDDGTNSNAVTLNVGTTTAAYSLTLPTVAPTTSQCLQSGASTAGLLVFGSCSGGSYINNGTTLQSSASFDIQATSSHVTGVLEANGADILDLKNSGAVNVASFGSTGADVFENSTNSTTAFQVQTSSAANVLNVDTTNSQVDIGGVATPGTLTATQAPIAGSLTGTAGSTSYTYYVTAVSANGSESLAASETNAALASNITTNHITVNWTTNGAAYYKIYREASGGTPSSTGLVGTSTTSSFVDTGYTAGATAPALATTGTLGTPPATFYYEVTALDNTYTTGGSIGQSTPSTQLMATTNAVNKSLTIDWAPVNGARAYNVYRTTTTGVYTTDSYYTVYTNSFTDTGGTATGTNTVPPTVSTAYGNTISDNANANVTIGSNGTAVGQLYVSGSVPTSAIGSVTTGTAPQTLYIQGNYAYVVNQTSSTLQVFDVSNPASPVLVGSVATGTAPYYVSVQGRYAYVVTSTSNTLQIFDVSNPASPSLAGSIVAAGSPRAVTVAGRYAYVTIASPTTELQIFDISNPTTPVSVGSIATSSYAFSVYVQGNYAYLGSYNGAPAYLQIFNVSNPYSPVAVGSIATSGGPYAVYVSGRYAYVINQTSNALQIFDVANPADPTSVGSVATSAGPTALYVQGRYAYVTSNTNTIQVFNVSNPASPTQVGNNITTGTSPVSIVVSGRYAYVVDSGSASLQIFDVGGAYIQQLQVGGAEVGTLQVDSNANVSGGESISGGLTVGTSAQVSGNFGVSGSVAIASQAVIGSIGTATSQLYVSGSIPTTYLGSVTTGGGLSYPYSVYVQGNYAYVAGDGGNLQIFDASTPASPTLIGSVGVGAGPDFVYVQGKYAYVTSYMANTLQIFDVSNPTTPVSVGSIGTGNEPYTVYIQGRYAYVGNYGASTLQIFNISNPASPTLTGSVATLTPYSVYVQGNYAYAVSGSNNTLQIFNISNPASPVSAGSVADSGDPQSVFVQGRYAYVANTGGALQIFDVSNPTSPSSAGSAGAGGGTQSVYVQGRYAYVVNYTANTLQTFDVSNPTTPVSVGSVSTGTNPDFVFVQGRYAYVAAQGSKTLEIFDLGGEYVQQLQAGGAEVGTLSVDANASVAGNQSIGGGLQVGGTAQISGNFGVSGSVAVTNITNSTTALSVQTSSGTSVLNVDTTNSQVDVGALTAPGTISTTLAPTISATTTGGTAGSSHYTYEVVAAGPNGSFTYPSPTNTLTTGNATLSGTNYNIVSWGSVSGATDYYVYRTFSNGSPSSTGLIDVVGIGTTTINDTGLTATGGAPNQTGSLPSTSTAYFFKVTAIDNTGGQTLPSAETSSITETTTTNNAISLSWAPVTGARGYDVYYATSSGAETNGYFTTYTNSYQFTTTSGTTAGSIPTLSTAYGNNLSANATATVTIGSNGTAQGQLYIGGTIPTTAIGVLADVGLNSSYAMGGYDYAVNQSNNTLQVINISNPANPVIVGTASTTGAPWAVYAQGSYAYVTNQSNSILQIFNISNPANPTLAGTATTNDPSFGISVQGDYAYTVTQGSPSSLQVINISNPASPSVVGTISLSAGSTPYNVYVQGNYAYVPNYGASTLQIINISNPTNPVVTDTMSVGNGPLNVYVQGSYAYLINEQSNNLEIINVSNPAIPVALSFTSFGGSTYPYAVAVQGEYAYVPLDSAYNETEVVNISNPYNPQVVGSPIPTGSNSSNVYVQGRYLYAIAAYSLEIYDIGGAYTNQLQAGGTETGTLQVDSNANVSGSESVTGGLQVGSSAEVSGNFGVSGSVAIASQAVIGSIGTATSQLYVSGSIPTSNLGSVSTGSYPDSVYVQGKYAYEVGLSSGTLQVIDVSVPSSPVVVGTSAPVGSPSSVYVQGKYAYVINNGGNALEIYDVSNPYSPSMVASVTTGTSPYSVYVQGRYAYVINQGSETLQVIDVSNPTLPVVVGTSATTGINSPYGIYVQGRYAYIVNKNAYTLQVFDVSNPATPTSVGSVGTGNSPESVYVQGSYAYVANYGSNTIQVIDVSNPASPTVTGTSATTGLNDPDSIYVQGRYAYATNLLGNTLQVFDVSNPATPTSVGSVGTGNEPYAVYVQGRYAYVVNYVSSTLQTFDLGGAYVQQLEAGGAEIGTLSVDANASVAGNESIDGGLQVGGTAQISGNFGVSGSVAVTNIANSTTALSVQTSAGTSVLNVDTTNSKVDVGALSAPGTITTMLAPTINATTTAGTAGTTHYTYEVVAEGPNGSFTYPSPTNTVTTGNATLSSSNYNIVSWGAVSGSTNYYVYRTADGTTATAVGLIGIVPTGTTTLNDKALSVSGGAAPALTGGLPSTSTAYFFKVTAIDSTGGQTTPSAETSSITETTTTNNAITLSWAPVAGARGYDVYYATSSGAETNGYFTTYTNSYEFTTTTGTTAGTIPTTSSAYGDTLSDNANSNFTIGSDGTSTAQLYVGGQAPTLVANLAMGIHPQGIFVSGSYVYVADDAANTLQIFNITNPLNPVLVGTSDNTHLNGPSSVAVAGNYAYITNDNSNSLSVYDISNPAGPSYVTSVIVGSEPDTSYIQGRYDYVANENNPTNNTLAVVDISNPLNPVVVGNVFTAATPLGVSAEGHYIYVADSGINQVQIFNVSNPAAPSQANAIITSGSNPRVLVSGDYMYITSNSTNVLQIYDITNPYGPVLVGSVSTATGPSHLYIQGHYVYVTGNNGSTSGFIEVFDVSNPYNPVLEAGPTTETNDGIASIGVVGRYAYIINQSLDSLQVFDLGGVDVQQFQAGAAEVGTLSVDTNATISGDETLNGGLIVGNSAEIDGNAGISGNLVVNGYIQAASIGAPGITSITQGGTAGTTSYSYAISALNAGGSTPAPLSYQTSTGNATLTGTNTNIITWGAITGATSYNIYRTASAGSPATTGLIGTVTAPTVTFTDTGIAATTAAPTTDTTGAITLNGGLTINGNLVSTGLGAIALTGGAASTWSTTAGSITLTSGSGNIILQPAGTGTTANVQVGAGNGGAGSTTPDLLVLDDKSAAGDPTEVNGAMYYNASTGNFRCGVAGSWENCIGGLLTSSSPGTAQASCTTACSAIATGTSMYPANYCVAGRIIDITANGVYSSTNASPTLALSVYIGTNAAKASDTLLGAAGVAITAGAATAQTNDGWSLNVQIYCVSTTSMWVEGGTEIVTSTTGIVFRSQIAPTAATTVTNTTQNLYIFPAWGTSSASNTITCTQFIVQGM